jgi:hypothetical protein
MRTIVDRLRRPAYTGLNRCWPCTVVNSVIAVATSLVLGVVIATRYGVVPGLAVEVGTLGVGAAMIYLRGYLVPGTPTLTTRYAPDWFLAFFGKTEVDRDEVVAGQENEGDAVEVERLLVEAGVLVERADGDLRTTDEIQSTWRGEIAALRDAAHDGDGVDRFLDAIGIEGTDVECDDSGSGFRVHVDGGQVGQWESRGAYLADAAGASLVAERVASWDDLGTRRRLELLRGLRLFLKRCPTCGGSVSFAAERVESCCHSRDVAAVTCDDCDAHLFETEPGAAALTL